MSYKVEALPDSHAELGEGPHWDIATQNLYFVDINVGKLLRFDYNQNKVYRAQIEGETYAGFVIPIEGQENKFAVGCGRRVVVVNWDGVSPTAKVERTLFEIQKGDENCKYNRLNDGKCDPRGRLYAGTMRYEGNAFDYRSGELFRFDKSGKVDVLKKNISISNGLTWNEKTKKFYYIDTADHEVLVYDYDFENGIASNPKVFLSLRKDNPDESLFPDGMTIDKDGNIFLAVFNTNNVYKVDGSTGKILLKIELPNKQITSVAFGGPNLDILFVTSSSIFNAPAPAGTTYKVTGLGTQGLPMAKMQI